MKLFTTILFFFLFLAGAFSQTRNVIVNTSSVVVQPTNFWSADASNARTELGLGSSATNPSSAFQPYSTILSNLSLSNGGVLTNITAGNIVGSVALASNVTGIVAIANGGSGAITASGARTNFGLNFPPLTNTNVINFRSDIGLGWSALTNTNSQFFFQGILATSDESAYPRIPATQLMAAGSSYGGINPSNYPTTLALKYVSTPDDGYGGIPPDNNTWTIANPSAFRSAISITLPALTNSNNSNFRSAINLGLSALTNTSNASFRSDIGLGLNALTNTNSSNFRSDIGLGLAALTNANNANFRSAIGLGWSALTNTNLTGFNESLYGSDASPVLVNSNGNVVGPANFWQQAPIQTYVQTFIPAGTTNSYATNARNLYVYSMTSTISLVTNTIVLPTDAATFNGDVATVTHTGTTSSVTSVSGDGGSTSLISISNNSESVKFIYEANQWTFYHNISFTEPFRFADGNIEENKAISRTNLGLGYNALTNTNSADFQSAIFSTNGAPTNSGNITFASADAWIEINVHTNGTTNSFRIPIFKAP